MSYTLTMEERETIIRIDRVGELAVIDTTDETMITKVKKLLEARKGVENETVH